MTYVPKLAFRERMKPIKHLTIRVAWHDSKWNGAVCANPSLNSFCVLLDRIREYRDDAAEDHVSGRFWAELDDKDLPPCKAESGFFMSSRPWVREFSHPYMNNKKCVETHGHLKKHLLKVPSYTAIAVPFSWMLIKHQKDIDRQMSQTLPEDSKAPFPTSWVFGWERQKALLNHVYGQIIEEKSLAIFYAKDGHPLGNGISRLVVGVGRILKLGKLEEYATDKGPAYPLWDRLVTHSIREDQDDGFLLPYHDYLKPTGNESEDQRRAKLLEEIAVPAPESYIRDFSYGSEVTHADVALSVLLRCLAAVRKVREHGIVSGPWQKREEWLNRQIALSWEDRGAYPGIGRALEALGLRLGTSLIYDIKSDGVSGPAQNPWTAVEGLFAGKIKLPSTAYAADLEHLQPTWEKLPLERKALLSLLSRFDLTSAQMKRAYDPIKRAKTFRKDVLDSDILSNPYLLAELDLGDEDDLPISFGVIDRGLLPDKVVSLGHPVAEPSRLDSPSDKRRIRCALVSILQAAARNGDTLLSVEECIDRLSKLNALSTSVEISEDWIFGNQDFLSELIKVCEIRLKQEGDFKFKALQLNELNDYENKLSRIVTARSNRSIPSLNEKWDDLLVKAIEGSGSHYDASNPRHKDALNEQVSALRSMVSRRFTVLVGQAGTGKTSVIGALVECKELRSDGILLLAPTGKARVRLMGKSGTTAMTVAQFLNSLGRYDGRRQRPLMEGKKQFAGAKTIVIDESSMLTLDALAAIMSAIDQSHVTRIILVGDPSQLPPIGAGRPFADIVFYLEEAKNSQDPETKNLAGALSRLTVEVRTKAGGPSDTLRLAEWYSGNPVSPESEQVMSDISIGRQFNDLEVGHWSSVKELRDKLCQQFVAHLGLKNEDDVQGFDVALGFDPRGWIKYDDPDGIENFQILSPVRMHPYGVKDLNRWIQKKYRAAAIENVRNRRGSSIGDEDIVVGDKAIQLINQNRLGYVRKSKSREKYYIANGEIGGVALGSDGYLNVYFAGRPGIGFGYRSSDFGEDDVPLELAYALTIHKAQGSQFKTVFVVIPKASRLLSRELLYTALTRSRERMVLLIEGEDNSLLYELSKPENSEILRRNSNLFLSILRKNSASPPYAENLIHKTEKGHMVRSKSELIIADLLFRMGMPYEYERHLIGDGSSGGIWPDFTFIDAAGDRIIWEHLGMMDSAGYRSGWEWKKRWYEKNGYSIDKNLFISEERKGGGLDTSESSRLRQLAGLIKSKLA